MINVLEFQNYLIILIKSKDNLLIKYTCLKNNKNELFKRFR